MSSLRLALKLSMMPDEESKEEAAKLEKDNNKDKEKALLPNTKRKRSASELSSDMSVTKPGRTDGIAIGTNSKSKKEKMEVVIIRPPLVYGPRVGANFLTLLKIVI